MKRAQSIHGEITRTTEFNTLNEIPKCRDHLGSVTVDAKKNLTHILFRALKVYVGLNYLKRGCREDTYPINCCTGQWKLYTLLCHV
jgi:hypothetical protein